MLACVRGLSDRLLVLLLSSRGWLTGPLGLVRSNASLRGEGGSEQGRRSFSYRPVPFAAPQPVFGLAVEPGSVSQSCGSPASLRFISRKSQCPDQKDFLIMS